MIELPPIPTWDGLHPLIVHFPIALLLIAPVFIALGMVVRKSAAQFSTAALILMALGTISAYVAVETGEAAGELATRTPQVMQVLEHHQELADTTRTVFSILTVAFAAILLAPRFLNRTIGRVPALALHSFFLVLYLAGTLVLVNTAHNGGRLVHELGVRALMDSPAQNELSAGAGMSK